MIDYFLSGTKNNVTVRSNIQTHLLQKILGGFKFFLLRLKTNPNTTKKQKTFAKGLFLAGSIHRSLTHLPFGTNL